MHEKIIILDFGSQTTQLIGRRVRELNVYCEIVPYNKMPKDDPSVIGVILSGSPFSVYDEKAFKIDLSEIRGKYPILASATARSSSPTPTAAKWSRQALASMAAPTCRQSTRQTRCSPDFPTTHKCG